jgi:hypothetical protein
MITNSQFRETLSRQSFKAIQTMVVRMNRWRTRRPDHPDSEKIDKMRTPWFRSQGMNISKWLSSTVFPASTKNRYFDRWVETGRHFDLSQRHLHLAAASEHNISLIRIIRDALQSSSDAQFESVKCRHTSTVVLVLCSIQGVRVCPRRQPIVPEANIWLSVQVHDIIRHGSNQLSAAEEN